MILYKKEMEGNEKRDKDWKVERINRKGNWLIRMEGSKEGDDKKVWGWEGWK